MSDKESEADRRRRDSVYERLGVLPEQLLHDLADTPIMSETEIDRIGTHRGELSPAELLVVLHLSHGLSPQMIAETLSKSPHTIKNQIRTARAAMNAKTNAHLVAIALRQGLID